MAAASYFLISDIDLLFLTEDEAASGGIKDEVRSICQTMWDIGLRVSPATRTWPTAPASIRTMSEFTLSLLDSRFLAGDSDLFERLHAKVLPQLIARESDALLQSFSEMTRARHHRFGNTIFHLEPNLKDGPGGLRDCHVSRWVGMIVALGSGRRPDLVSVRTEFGTCRDAGCG